MNDDKRLALLRQLHALCQEHLVPPDLKAQGWRYLDIPGKLTPQAWRLLLAVLGEGEYKLLVQSSGEDHQGPWIRGQFLVSPQGWTNLCDRERHKTIVVPTHSPDGGLTS